MVFGPCKKAVNNILGFYRVFVRKSPGILTHGIQALKRRNRFIGEVNSSIELRKFHIQETGFSCVTAIEHNFCIHGIPETEIAFGIVGLVSVFRENNSGVPCWFRDITSCAVSKYKKQKR